jgi:hypothetical protein
MLSAMNARQSTIRTLWVCIGVLVAAGFCGGPARAQQTQQPQQRKQPKPIVTLPSLTAQGFEIKASLGSSLVLQKGKDVWICDMLLIKSNCDAAE